MRTIPLLLLIGLLVLPARGQTILSKPYEPNQLSVEAISPDAEGASILSGATFLTATVSVTSNITLTGELPLARFDATADGGSSNTAVGNPYVGLGFSGTYLPVLLELGARIPAAPSNTAARFGQLADIGRVPAFQPDEFSLSGLLNRRFTVGRNANVRLRSGLSYASRPAPNGRDRDWRLLYEAQLWREGERLLTGFSFAGRTPLTNRSSQHHAVLSIMGNWRLVQPGIMAGVALNDLVENGAFSPFVGLTLSITSFR